MPESIRVNTGKITLEVNDAGETISFNPRDPRFAEKFGTFTMAVMEKEKEFGEKVKEFEKPDEDADGAEMLDASLPAIRMTNEFCEWCEEQIDDVFGPETCRKVFGGDRNPEAYGLFIELLTPYFEKAKKQAIQPYKKPKKK